MLKVFRLNGNLRFYATKHAAQQSSKFTSTINLPRTKFPSRLTAAKRQQIESSLVESTFAAAYRYQEQHNHGPTFVLHDGPPYANGDLHVGHAVNKILKDITLRQHAVKGLKVNYIPGWDCHGLPIELKAMTTSQRGKAGGAKPDALAIRQKSRQFALDAIERQKQEFRSWGILSDWGNPSSIYLTFQPDFITNQLRMFLDLYARGFVYRDLKPVYWSPSSRTALAEAELEYDPEFVSPSVFLRFAVESMPALPSLGSRRVYALVWTTTPWTLPSNQAICYNADLEYAFVKLQGNCDELYLIATNLIGDFALATQMTAEIVEKVKGCDLAGCTYRHPIDTAQTHLPFYAAAHVQDTKGTGLVHTAPAHGPEDFLVSLQQKIPVHCFVDEAGMYSAEAPEFLRGKFVLHEGDDLVLQHIAKDVMHASKFSHSCPIDWRTKKPVIIRASEQWFINTDKLKERAVQEIDKVEIYPRVNAEGSKKALMQQVRKRPYWCISRQRVWGVPIPVFYEKTTGKVVTNKAIVERISDMVRVEGNIDFWWTQDVSEILPVGLLQAAGFDSAGELAKGTDIFDIWFDSGSTWSQVLGGEQVADLYLEGYDQFTGWFQSSLLTSVAARDCAPYKALFVHGFTVDEKGHKMSKSLGNIVSPKQITQKYGVDVLRWWVAAHATQNMSVTVSDKLLQQTAESVSKVRAILRYLNGVIGDRTPQLEDGRSQTTSHLNKYLLSSLVSFEAEIEKHYKSYEFNRVVAAIQNFVANEISAVYVHLIKDRLYCGDRAEFEAIRFTLANCYEVLCRALWPITPFLVEESWSYYDAANAFHTTNVRTAAAWQDSHVENVVLTALQVKRLINQQTVDNSWTLAVKILCRNPEKLQQLQQLQPDLNVPAVNSELCELLQVNSVQLVAAGGDASRQTEDFRVEVASLGALQLCARCRRFAVAHADCTCARCTDVLNVK